MAAISDIITPQVSQAGRRIFAEQLRIAQSHRLKKSGHLVDALSSPSYNRVVYGILAETKRRIQYGFTDEVLQSLRQQLIQAGATLLKKT